MLKLCTATGLLIAGVMMIFAVLDHLNQGESILYYPFLALAIVILQFAIRIFLQGAQEISESQRQHDNYQWVQSKREDTLDPACPVCGFYQQWDGRRCALCGYEQDQSNIMLSSR